MSLRDSIDLIMQSVDFDEGTRAKMWGILQNMSAKQLMRHKVTAIGHEKLVDHLSNPQSPKSMKHQGAKKEGHGPSEVSRLQASKIIYDLPQVTKYSRRIRTQDNKTKGLGNKGTETLKGLPTHAMLLRKVTITRKNLFQNEEEKEMPIEES